MHLEEYRSFDFRQRQILLYYAIKIEKPPNAPDNHVKLISYNAFMTRM